MDYEVNAHNNGKEYLYIVLEYAEVDMAGALCQYQVHHYHFLL